MTTVPKARVLKSGDSSSKPRGSAPPEHVIELAPRTVPRTLVAWLLLGGRGAFGWGFAVFGMLIALIVVPFAMPDLASYDATTFGTVQHVEVASTTKHGAPYEWRVTYAFEDPNGQLRHGVSYSSDRVEKNSERMVEYTRADPNVSRLRGARRSRESPIALILLVFPIVGLAIAGQQLVRGIRAVHLLRSGVETTGKIVEVTEVRSGSRNRTPTVRAVVEYLVGERSYRTTVDYSQADAPDPDSAQRLIYDPQLPSRSAMLDALPGQPRITEDGNVASTTYSAVLVFLAPGAFLIELAAIPFVLAS